MGEEPRPRPEERLPWSLGTVTQKPAAELLPTPEHHVVCARCHAAAGRPCTQRPPDNPSGLLLLPRTPRTARQSGLHPAAHHAQKLPLQDCAPDAPQEPLSAAPSSPKPRRRLPRPLPLSVSTLNGLPVSQRLAQFAHPLRFETSSFLHGGLRSPAPGSLAPGYIWDHRGEGSGMHHLLPGRRACPHRRSYGRRQACPTLSCPSLQPGRDGRAIPRGLPINPSRPPREAGARLRAGRGWVQGTRASHPSPLCREQPEESLEVPDPCAREEFGQPASFSSGRGIGAGARPGSFLCPEPAGICARPARRAPFSKRRGSLPCCSPPPCRAPQRRHRQGRELGPLPPPYAQGPFPVHTGALATPVGSPVAVAAPASAHAALARCGDPKGGAAAAVVSGFVCPPRRRHSKCDVAPVHGQSQAHVACLEHSVYRQGRAQSCCRSAATLHRVLLC